MFGRKREIEVTEVNENFILIENNFYKKHDEKEEKLLIGIIKELVHVTDLLVTGKHKEVELVFTSIINHSKLKVMALELKANEFSLGTLALVDKDNQSQIAATFSNVSFSGSNDAAFTVSPDASDPNTANVKGVAEGTGTVSGSADVSYTDSSGNAQTKSLTVSVDVTVSAVVVEQNVELQLNFATPQPQ